MAIPYAEVIGDPIAHSKSPAIHEFWLEKLGLEGEFRATRVGPMELAAHLDARREDPDWRGCSVTMPLKAAACWRPDLIDQLSHRAGATNCIGRDKRGLIGLNTDVPGFLEPLAPLLAPYLERPGAVDVTAQIVGAGAAARAVAVALEDRFRLVAPTFFNRDPLRAEAMSREFRGHSDSGFPLAHLKGYARQKGQRPEITVLVNATPMGMAGYPSLQVDLSTYGDDTIVYDLVYSPAETPLLAEARQYGMRTISGLDMLIAQAAPAFELFFAVPAPRAHDAELRTRLMR